MAQELHPWDQFKDLKAEAYLYIDQALRLEETDRSDRALTMYERGLSHLDKALDLPIDLPGSKQEDLDALHKIRTKMIRTRQEIVFRMRELQQPKHLDVKKDEPPPTYTQATGSGGALPSDALILFHIPDQVNIFYINAQGQVTTPYQPSALYLYKFHSPTSEAGNVESIPAMLQVGSWVYPLVPGKSPVLKSKSGSYMFPDLDASIAGNAVGLLLPPEVTEDQRCGFELLLNQLTDANIRNKENLSEYDEYIKVSGQLAEGMTQGAEAVGKGLVKGAIKGAELMKKGTDKLMENMAPAGENVPVDPKLKTSLEAASWTADKAVKVSGYLVSKAGQATVALGRFLAPHIQTGGAKALSHLVEQSEEKSQKQLRIASDVASGSISAISTVYMALENSSKILAKNIAENTVEVVKHKYLAVYNAGALGPKGLAKRLAKDTGKVAVGVPEQVIKGQIELDVPTPGPVNGDDIPDQTQASQEKKDLSMKKPPSSNDDDAKGDEKSRS